MPESTTPQLTESEVEKIEKRHERATQGPWEIRPSTLPPYSVGVVCQYESHDCLFIPDSAGAMIDGAQMIANMEFVCEARTDIPALIRDWRALRQLVEIQSRESDGDLTTIGKALAANAALRDQLAQAQTELEELRNFKQDMEGEFLGI